MTASKRGCLILLSACHLTSSAAIAGGGGDNSRMHELRRRIKEGETYERRFVPLQENPDGSQA